MKSTFSLLLHYFEFLYGKVNNLGQVSIEHRHWNIKPRLRVLANIFVSWKLLKAIARRQSNEMRKVGFFLLYSLQSVNYIENVTRQCGISLSRLGVAGGFCNSQGLGRFFARFSYKVGENFDGFLFVHVSKLSHGREDVDLVSQFFFSRDFYRTGLNFRRHACL